jgi:hypothetical protein
MWGGDIAVGWDFALLALLLSFVLSASLAWVYRATYEGLSYQRGFVQTLALGGPVAAMAMLAIGDDLARGLGLVGALTLIRFRATLKDTKDLVFAFASLGIGVACGVTAIGIAVLGALVFSTAALLLYWTGFGSRRAYDAVLRLRSGYEDDAQASLTRVLGRHCRGYTLVNMRDLGGSLQEQSYQLRLVNRRSGGALLHDLSKVNGVEGPSLLMQESLLEA